MKSGFSSVGRAPDCRSGSRRFEPDKPDTNNIPVGWNVWFNLSQRWIRSYSEIASRLIFQ